MGLLNWIKRNVGVRRWLLSQLAQADSARREIIVAMAFLLFLMLVGTLGYMLLEGWPWDEGFYMTFITLTTIGFTEVEPLSSVGRFFTIFIATFGIGAAGFIATRAAQLIITNQHLRERRIQRMIERMDQHFVICGYGRTGRRIIQDLEHSGHAFVVIENDDEKIEELREARIPFVDGDARDDDVLKAAGVKRARGVILTLPDDSANVFVTLAVRELNPDVFIVARTDTHRNQSKLKTAGANKVVAPTEVGADRMAQVIVRPHVDRFMEQVLHTGALGLQMDEVRVEEGAPLAGKSLAESNFRQQFDAVVIALVDPVSNEVTFNPGAHARIQPGNVLVVLGDQTMIKRLRENGCTA